MSDVRLIRSIISAMAGRDNDDSAAITMASGAITTADARITPALKQPVLEPPVCNAALRQADLELESLLEPKLPRTA